MEDIQIAKLVLAGPVGSGKSTAIAALADTPPVTTEMPLTDGPMGNKVTTTVALDFTTAILDDGTPLFLYGMPGQEHFAFMREIVLNGALGVLVLLDGRSPGLTAEFDEWIDAVRGIDPTLPLALGITHTDLLPGFSMWPIREAMRRRGLAVPVFTIDARKRAQVAQLVRALLASAE